MKTSVTVLFIVISICLYGQSDTISWNLEARSINKFDRLNSNSLHQVVGFRFSDKKWTLMGVYYYISGYEKRIYFEFKQPLKILSLSPSYESNGELHEILPLVRRRKLSGIYLVDKPWSD
jgi:hypothetical protein